MKVTIDKGNTINTDHLSIDALRELHERLCNNSDAIVFKIQEAKANSQRGEYADPLWWRRINLANRKMARARETLKQEIADRKRSERIAENVQWQIPKIFMHIARQRLAPETYGKIMAEAKQSYMNSQQGHEELVNYVFEVGE